METDDDLGTDYEHIVKFWLPASWTQAIGPSMHHLLDKIFATGWNMISGLLEHGRFSRGVSSRK
jgi:hypothetical protein